MSRPEQRKRALSDILESGAGLAFRRILVFLRITALLTLPVGVLLGAAIVWVANSSGSQHSLAIGLLVPVAVVYAIAAMLSGAACLKVAAEAYNGAKPGAREAIEVALRRLGPIVCLTTLLVIAVVPTVALLVLPGLTAIGKYSLVLLVLAVFSLWATGTYSVALPAMLLEERGIRESLRRSGLLVHRNFFKALGTVLFGGVLALFAGTVVAIIVSLFSLGGGNVILIVTLAGFVLGELLVAPFYAAFLIVLYHDLQAREQGSNVESMS
ncbi:MAG: hypothetical protein WBQ14_00730 [Gaiellaceae bacterium]